jgi:hypothetical protein
MATRKHTPAPAPTPTLQVGLCRGQLLRKPARRRLGRSPLQHRQRQADAAPAGARGGAAQQLRLPPLQAGAEVRGRVGVSHERCRLLLRQRGCQQMLRAGPAPRAVTRGDGGSRAGSCCRKAA